MELVPRRVRYSARDVPLDQLAASFGVSSEAMSWRVYNFGLTDRKPD
jgi:Zn-dependent peptidase ImmA (M78 family)